MSALIQRHTPYTCTLTTVKIGGNAHELEFNILEKQNVKSLVYLIK